jgi:hypothetical protein
MKTLAIVLIIFQILAYISGQFDLHSHRGSTAQTVAYLLGYNFLGILGIVLLIRSNKKTKKRTQDSVSIDQ